MTMTSKEFLDWVADRLVNVYGESENVDFVQRLRQEAASVPSSRHETWEYGVERGPFPHVGIDVHIEWGGSYGMTHSYVYTADNVHALAGGRLVWRRKKTTFPTVTGEPERFTKEMAKELAR